MNSDLFNVELPIVTKDKELNKLISIYSKYDPYFIASGSIEKRKEKFNKLWVNYKPYADSNFLSEIKTNFHQRTWEMYVGNVLLRNNLKIESYNEGPDFIIDNIGYLECIAPTRGDNMNPDSVPELYVAKTPEEISVRDVPVDKIILRITQAIKDKALIQYENWKSKKWFDDKKPFIIAINTADLQYPEDINMPYVIKALFGFQFMQINIKTGDKNYSHRNVIEKSNKTNIPVTYFIDPDFNFISGVLFSNKTVLNHPDKIGEDCIFINNPLAINHIDESFKKLFNSWNATKTNSEISIVKNY